MQDIIITSALSDTSMMLTFVPECVHICFFLCSADMQKAIDSENYGVAAQLRDEITKLEVKKEPNAYLYFADYLKNYILQLG